MFLNFSDLAISSNVSQLTCLVFVTGVDQEQVQGGTDDS